MIILTRKLLLNDGYKLNPHFWLPGFYYCGICQKYSLFYALSKWVNGMWKNIEICRDCNACEFKS